MSRRLDGFSPREHRDDVGAPLGRGDVDERADELLVALARELEAAAPLPARPSGDAPLADDLRRREPLEQRASWPRAWRTRARGWSNGEENISTSEPSGLVRRMVWPLTVRFQSRGCAKPMPSGGTETIRTGNGLTALLSLAARPQHERRDDDARQQQHGAAEAAPCQRCGDALPHLPDGTHILPAAQQQAARQDEQTGQRDADDVGAGERQRTGVEVAGAVVAAAAPPPSLPSESSSGLYGLLMLLPS